VIVRVSGLAQQVLGDAQAIEIELGSALAEAILEGATKVEIAALPRTGDTRAYELKVIASGF
jgi:hypothetical protein